MFVFLGLSSLIQNDSFQFHPFLCKFHDTIIFNCWQLYKLLHLNAALYKYTIFSVSIL